MGELSSYCYGATIATGLCVALSVATVGCGDSAPDDNGSGGAGLGGAALGGAALGGAALGAAPAGGAAPGGASEGGGGQAPALQLELLAGSIGGPGNIDGAAARYNGPAALVSDGAGHVYIADANNAVIRKFDVATGVTTTIAGKAGVVGFDDGVGAQAQFAEPVGLAISGGALYVSDLLASTIRRVDLSTGAVTTIAGTPTASGYVDGIGAASNFFAPAGLAADETGNLYVADVLNYVVRKIVLSTGEVSTFAGAGVNGIADGFGTSAEFNFPTALVFDGGDLFLADTWGVAPGAAIRRIALSDAAVTTVAGNYLEFGQDTDGTGTQARFCDLRSIAADGAGNLYVTDSCNSSIRKIVVSSQEVTTIAGATGMFGSADGIGSAARFYAPSCLTSDGAAGLYISDGPSYWNYGNTQGNHTIRNLALATGEVNTISGKAPQAGSPGNVDGAGGAARFNFPSKVTADQAGNAYVLDELNYAIRKVVLATGETSTVASGLEYPVALTADGTDKLYLADVILGFKSVVPSTGAVSGLGSFIDENGDPAEFGFPSGLATDGTGNLYVADPGSQLIRKLVVSTGVVSTVAGQEDTVGSADGIGTAAQFNSPTDLALDGIGNLYVADRVNQTIRKIVLATAEVTTIAGTAEITGSADGVGAAASFDLPQSIDADTAGNLYVADFNNNTIRKIVAATGVVTTLVGVPGDAGIELGPLPARLNAPSGVVALPMNQLLITDSRENSLLIVR